MEISNPAPGRKVKNPGAKSIDNCPSFIIEIAFRLCQLFMQSIAQYK